MKNLQDLSKKPLKKSFDRAKDWTEYHAETLAEFVDDEETNNFFISRKPQLNEKSINLWHDGYHELAIAKLEQFIITGNHSLDIQMRGWLEQLAARIADKWGEQRKITRLTTSSIC
ncbi:hypothetical protein ACFSQ7_05815 [Paenibacillus rhizoplanae]